MTLEFTYNPLDKTLNEIRLVTLKAGSASHKIECVLSKCLLEQSPAYEALSYAWGTSAETILISIDGRRAQITMSLQSALRHLRRQEEDRVLWIDAICIDQNNNQEKNHQVRMMTRIYESAHHVVIWLGERSEHSGLALEKIMVASKSLNRRTHQSVTLQQVRADIFGPEAWAALLNLFDLEWWTRTWVVQEVAVAKQAILVCGKESIPADSFDDGINNIHFIRWMDTRRNGVAEEMGYTRTVKEMGNPGKDLLYLAQKCRKLRSTDPRDKLYALLGLATEMDFEIDYSLPVCTVYGKFVEACIERSGTLDILNFVRVIERDDLSSWIPDWTCIDFETLIPYESWDKPPFFKASGDSVAEFESLPTTKRKRQVTGVVGDHITSGLCYIKGFITDVIQHVSDPLVDFESSQSSQTELMQQWISIFEAHTDASGPYKTKEARINAFWITLVADANYNRRPSRDPDFYEPFYRRWFAGKWEPHPQFDTHLDVPDFQTSFFRAAGARKLLVSKKGYVGLAPLGARVGDLICILFGGQTPFVLRRAMGANEVREDCAAAFGGSGSLYFFMGESYVHGLMDGEAYEEFQQGEGDQQESFVVL